MDFQTRVCFSVTISFFLLVVMKISVFGIHHLQIQRVTCLLLFSFKNQNAHINFFLLSLVGRALGELLKKDIHLM